MDKVSQSQDTSSEKERVRFIVGIGPKLVAPLATKEMMRGVLVALAPAVFFSIYLFGLHSLYLYLVCGLSAVLTEGLSQKIRRIKITIDDFSALLTGVLLAMCLPPTFPLWMGSLGSVFAIVMGKVIFGGLGSNIFNPALLGRAFLSATFPTQMTTYFPPFYYRNIEALTTATPLGTAKFSHLFASYHDLFFGFTGGSLGETSAFLLLVGGVFIIAKGYADWRITVSYLLTVFFFSGLFYLWTPTRFPPPAFHLLAGGLFLGAFFMATDPVTTPVFKKGRVIFGIGCGIFTVLVRLFGGMPEGVAYSILFMNSLTPLINRLSRPRRFGQMPKKKR